MNQFLRSAFLVTFCCSLLSAYAQLPPNQPEQDCINALSICQDVYVQTNAYSGAGENPDEINGSTSCLLLGERNSVWYIFTVQTQGQLCFTIAPTDPQDDYDWALYDLTNRNCSQIATNPNLEVSCSWTYNNGCNGATGANGNTIACPGQSQPCLNVNPGETYVLNISNFTSSNSGYTLDFSQSTARLFDDIPPTMQEMESFCTGVSVSFSENILCGTVDPSDFAFAGPDGPYTISTVMSDNCDDGGSFDRTFDLIISPPIQQAGFYTLSLVGSVTDNCGNSAVLESDNVWMPLPPTADISAPAPQCLLDNQFYFAYPGPSSVQNYYWDFGDSVGSTLAGPVHSYQTAGEKDVSLVIVDVNGCADTARTNVTVMPKPDARFLAPSTVCQFDTISFQNETTFPGSAQASMIWEFSDGTTTTDISPIHEFVLPGRFRAHLEAYNNLGCKDTFGQTIMVFPTPEVDFSVEADVCHGDSAHLLYMSTINPNIANDMITGWTWAYGDSTFEDDLIAPAHLYDTAGTYPVVLTVVSDKGCASSLEQDQIIYQPAPPTIEADSACFGTVAFLEALPDEGGVTRWFTEFNGTKPFSILPVHYTDPVTSNYDLYVDQLSQEGCFSERVVVEVRHHTVGVGNIVASDTVVEFPDPIVDFSLAGSILANQYEWIFGDDNVSTEATPSHPFAYDHIFTVKLKATDIYGCEYDLRRKIEVKNVVTALVPTAFTPNGDGRNDFLYIGHRLLQSFDFQVFNRAGNKVFQTTNPDFQWSGRTESGKPLMEGVYIYVLSGMDWMGNPIRDQGTISLIR